MSFFGRFEKLLLYVALCCIVMLITVQALLFKDASRHYLSWVDRLEGETISLQIPIAAGNPVSVSGDVAATNRMTLWRLHKTIQIRALAPATTSDAFVTVNGTRVGDFSRGEASFSVFEGDYLEIDATALRQPGRFIVHTNDQVTSPVDGLVIEGHGKPLPISKVVFLR